MKSLYIWNLRLWFFEIGWKRKGLVRIGVSYLSRKYFVGKREFALFKEGKRIVKYTFRL